MTKRNILLIALLTVLVAWIPSVPWESVRKSIEPWTALITILATALSPLIAVQSSRIIEEARASRAEKSHVFRVLFEFRQARLQSVEFARAISLINLVFDGTSSSEKAIRGALDKYVSTTNEWSASETGSPELNRQASDQATELIYLISEHLGKSISRESIARNGVFPAWVGIQQQAVLKTTEAQIKVAEALNLLASRYDRGL
jgi:hypothetical protein